MIFFIVKTSNLQILKFKVIIMDSPSPIGKSLWPLLVTAEASREAIKTKLTVFQEQEEVLKSKFHFCAGRCWLWFPFIMVTCVLLTCMIILILWLNIKGILVLWKIVKKREEGGWSGNIPRSKLCEAPREELLLIDIDNQMK